MREPIVIYHANCSDGFAAAWVLYQKFPKATFIPAQYGNDPPPIDIGPVYVVDFSYPREVMVEMDYKSGHNLIVLDHHITAEENCKDLSFCIFDITKSGARLTWDFINNTAPPDLILYVEDRDLWKFQLPYSKEINAAIRSYSFSFVIWDNLDVKSLRIEGEAIERYRQQLIAAHVRNAKEVELAGYKVKAVQCTAYDIISEVGQELIGDTFSVCYFDIEGYRVYSLRSNNVDVSVIAKSFGGGGHAKAAGFRMPR